MTRSSLLRISLAAALAAPAGATASQALETLSLPGAAAGDSFGKSAAALGDVDGDGVGDFAVGAPFADFAASSDGTVRIFFGGSDPASITAGPLLAGSAADDQFGISVDGGFDFDADGFDDVAVGARFDDLAAGDAGSVFVHFGGPGLGTDPPLALPGEAADDWFGQSVSRAGDVNGDGFGDLVVGAPFNDAVAKAAGRAYVYLGSSSPDGVPDRILEGAAAQNAHFGWSVGGGGDLNCDGFSDVVVGARLHGSGPNRARGRVYVFFGGAPMDATPDLIVEGNSTDDWLGESVAVAEDMDGDGCDELLAGAIFADPATGSAAGEASVYLGGSAMDATPDAVLPGPHGDAQLGNSVAGAGDADGDGYGDAIAGAHFADGPAGASAGQALVLLGGPVVDGSADATLHGAAAGDQLGESVSSAGRAAGPDASALLAGAHFSDANGEGSGEAVVARFRACDDGIDNDGDGRVDLGTATAATDPGCEDAQDGSEKAPDLACDDGVDNDGDGFMDFRTDGLGDPGCAGAKWSTEEPKCQDGLDNDSDGGIDFDGGASLNGGIAVADPDPQCDEGWQDREAQPSCGLGFELGLVLLPLSIAYRRRRLRAG